MEFSNLANMKLSDFENIGKAEYNKGFAAALETVVKVLDSQICQDYVLDGECQHDGCVKISQVAEGLMNVKNNIA